MEKYIDIQFKNASYFREAGLQKKIRQQPGYRRGETMALKKTIYGKIRLYVLLSEKWMDASLKDI